MWRSSTGAGHSRTGDREDPAENGEVLVVSTVGTIFCHYEYVISDARYYDDRTWERVLGAGREYARHELQPAFGGRGR